MFNYFILLGVAFLLAGGYWFLARRPVRILFIGNSFSQYGGGVERQSLWFFPLVLAQSSAKDGYSLQRHWQEGHALAALRGGRWDYVVLQDNSQAPVLEREQFFESVRRFDQAVRLRGGKTVLFMTWERPDAVGKGITTANVAEAYHAIGAELGAVVAPVGLVFAQSLQARPDIVLNEADGHPTAAGSYLAACVIMGKVLGKVPWGIPYASRAMRREMRAYLREAAASGLAGALRG